MSRYCNPLAAFAGCLLTLGVGMHTATVQAEDWGTLSGTFIYDGKAPTPAPIVANKDPEVCGKHKLHDESLEVASNGGIANVVVYLRTEGVTAAPEYEKTAKDEVVLDNKDCRFQPHVAVVRTSQTLLLKNSDPVGHNSKLDPLKNPPVNPIIPAGADTKVPLPDEEALPIKVGCNIHPWMGAWVVVRKGPYATVSSDQGSFSLQDLPAGKELEFQLWQEKAGYLKDATIKGVKVDKKGRFKLTLKPGANDLGEIKVASKGFK